MFAAMDGSAPARPRLSVVLPARDEEENVGAVIENVRRRVVGLVSAFEVIVVDDGSEDGTAARVRALAATDPGVRLVSHPRGRGYGAALRSGFAAARYEWIFFSDADGQFPLGELPTALAALRTHDAVIGCRHRRADPLARRLLGRLWSLLARRATGVAARDVNCAFKLFPRSAIARADLRSDGAAISTEILLALSEAGLRIAEIGVAHEPRRAGSQTGARAGVALRAATELLRLARHRRGRRLPALGRPDERTVRSVDLVS